MNVAFFGQSGPYSPTALRYLVQGPKPYHVRLVIEGVSRRILGQAHRWQRARRCVAPPTDDLAATAVAAGIDTLQTSDVNATYILRQIAQRSIDILVCVGFNRLFSPALLATAPVAALNAHPSALPAWRGPSPLFWAFTQACRALP